MEAKNTDKQNRINMLIFVAVALVVVIMAVVAITIMFNYNSQKPYGTVQFVTNPSVTMVINDNDRVIALKYDNQDAETLLADTNLLGKTIDEVAQIYVQLCCEAGFIDTSYSSSGQSVDVVVSNTSSAKVQEIKSRVINIMNDYFDENGVIAGAVDTTMQNLQAQADLLEVDINKYIMILDVVSITDDYTQTQLAEMSESELLDTIVELYHIVDGIAYVYYSEYSGLHDRYAQEYSGAIQDVIASINSATQNQFELDVTLQTDADSFIEQIENSSLAQDVKDSCTQIINSAREQINTALSNAKSNLEDNRAEIIENSKDAIENSKNLLEGRLDSYQKSFDANLEYFNAHKNEVLQKIDSYRNSLIN